MVGEISLQSKSRLAFWSNACLIPLWTEGFLFLLQTIPRLYKEMLSSRLSGICCVCLVAYSTLQTSEWVHYANPPPHNEQDNHEIGHVRTHPHPRHIGKTRCAHKGYLTTEGLQASCRHIVLVKPSDNFTSLHGNLHLLGKMFVFCIYEKLQAIVFLT